MDVNVVFAWSSGKHMGPRRLVRTSHSTKGLRRAGGQTDGCRQIRQKNGWNAEQLEGNLEKLERDERKPEAVGSEWDTVTSREDQVDFQVRVEVGGSTLVTAAGQVGNDRTVSVVYVAVG